MAVTSQQVIDTYRYYLNRTPGTLEVNFWVDYSRANGAEQTNLAFLASARAELQDITRSAYQNVLGRTPAQSEVDFWTDYALNSGVQEASAAFMVGAEREIAGRSPPAQTTTTTTNTVDFLKRQLKSQYDAVIEQNPQLKYPFSDRLDSLFDGQAKMLADAGITNIEQVGTKYEPFDVRSYGGALGGTDGAQFQQDPLGIRYLVDKRTGQRLNFKDNYEGFRPEFDLYYSPTFLAGLNYPNADWQKIQRWGEKSSRGERNDFLIFWDENSNPVFMPLYRKVDTSTDNALQMLKVAATFFFAMVSPELGKLIHSTAFGKTIGLTASNIAAGAITGGVTAGITGQNVIKGALKGAVGSVSSTTYAEAVGRSLGITSQAAAITAGNAIINAGLSGIQAALTPNANIVNSMLGGAVKGAIIADPAVLANALVGGEANLQRLISGTNLNLEQAQQIITRSIGDAFALSIQGGNFFNLLGEGLIANGISTSVANGINSAIGRNLSDEARMALVVGGQGIADVTVRAALNNRSISNDLSRAGASIVSAGLIAANMTAGEKARLEELRKNQTVLNSPPLTQVLLASANTGTISDAVDDLGWPGLIELMNGISGPTIVADPIIVTAPRWTDTWLNTVTSIWNDFSSFLGQYARYQKDNVIRSIIGLANISQSIYGVGGAGPGGALSTNIEALERVKQNLTKLLSAEATGNRREAYKILKEAEGTGRLNELLSGFRAFAQDPSGFVSEGLGSVIPNLIGGSIASGASLAARLATQLGINIPGAVGNVKQEIYNEVYQSARKAGLSNVDAVAMATDAQSYTGRNTDAIALAAAIGGIATLIPGSVEQQLVRRIAAQSAAKVATRAVTAGAIEKVTELVQSLQSGVSANVAINRIPDPRIEMIRQAGVNSEVGREIQRQINAMPWNRGLLDGNVLGKAILEATTAFAVGTGLSLGLSIQDINRLAIDAAADRGQRVNWEVLDAPARSNLIVKAFVPPEIVDVVATDITKLLTAPPATGVDTGTVTPSLPGGGGGGGAITPSLPGPSDQNVIDVIDTGPSPITPTPVTPTPVTPVTPTPVTPVAPAPVTPAPVVPTGPTPAQVFETDIGRVRGQEPKILTQVEDPTIQVITAIQNDIDLLISNRNAIIDIFQNLDNATRQELEPVFRRNDQDLQQKIQDLTQLQDTVIGEVRTELTETARGRRQELDIERFEQEQEEFEKALKELEDAIAKAKSDAEKTQARQLFATQQRERLQEAGRITGGLQGQIDAELNNLLNQYEDAQRRADRAATQKEGLVAPQQPDPTRPVTDEEIMRLTGITPDEAGRIGITVPPPGEEQPIAGPVTPTPVEPPEGGVEDEAPPPTDEDKETPLSPVVIYEQPRPRGTPGIPSRVTPEAVTGILGPKEPLFGSDDDPQVALWNRRSLRLRKALGL